MRYEELLTPADLIEDFGIKRIIEEYGIQKVIEEIGLSRVIEEIGLDKVIAEIGVDRLLSQLGLDNIFQELRDYSRRLIDGHKTGAISDEEVTKLLEKIAQLSAQIAELTKKAE